MKLFIDTANLQEIREIAAWGVLDGVTTNPTLIAKEGVDIRARVAEICDVVPGPVSAEVVAQTHDEMVAEGKDLAQIAPNVYVKLAFGEEGLKACRELTELGIHTNVTLVFSPAQAMLAGRAGATLLSPFLGRVDDIGNDSMAVLGEIVGIFRTHRYETQVLAASLRHPRHVVDAAKTGAHIGTLPYAVFKQMLGHPLTDIGAKRFLEDWNELQAKLPPQP